MKRLVLLTVSVILTGTVMLYVNSISPPLTQDTPPKRAEEDTNNAVLITDSTSKVSAGRPALPKTRKQDGLTTSLNTTFISLNPQKVKCSLSHSSPSGAPVCLRVTARTASSL